MKTSMQPSRLSTAGARARRTILAACFLVFTFAATPADVCAGSLEDFRAAVDQNDAKLVANLIARGFDANMRYEAGNAGLHIAAAENAADVMAVLLAAPGIHIEIKNAADETALMQAAIRGHRAVFDLLIAAGAQLNKPGWTPLHYAATNGHDDLVRTMLIKHAFIDPKSPNGTTPLMMAARQGHLKTIKLLLNEGADILIRNEQGMSAYDFAVRHQYKDIEQFLAAYEAQKRRELATNPAVPAVDLNAANP